MGVRSRLRIDCPVREFLVKDRDLDSEPAPITGDPLLPLFPISLKFKTFECLISFFTEPSTVGL